MIFIFKFKFIIIPWLSLLNKKSTSLSTFLYDTSWIELFTSVWLVQSPLAEIFLRKRRCNCLLLSVKWFELLLYSLDEIELFLLPG